MPTYDYLCKDCGHEEEIFQSMKEEPLTTCTKCNGRFQRLISKGVGIVFRGSGFYINDKNKKSNSSTKTKKESAKKPNK